jgi:hypothetical protein
MSWTLVEFVSVKSKIVQEDYQQKNLIALHPKIKIG